MNDEKHTEKYCNRKLFPFEGHPFKVQDNEEMNALIESIQEQGIFVSVNCPTKRKHRR